MFTEHTPCLIEFITHFSREENVVSYLEEMKWGDEKKCPFCRGKRYYTLGGSDRRLGYKCANKFCNKKFNVRIGTIFESSKIPLSKWMLLLWMLSTGKKNISSRQAAKNLNITQNASWQINHKIRFLFREKKEFLLSGIVEIDECFIGKGKNLTQWGAFSTRKAPILGLMERGGRIIIKTIDTRHRNNLEKEITKYVELGSTVYTDGWMGYRGLQYYYNHEWVNHSEKEYVREATHTNSIECAWSNFKKSIRAAHHQISGKHVQLYCDHFAYKYNRRHWKPMKIFNDLLLRSMKMQPMALEKPEQKQILETA